MRWIMRYGSAALLVLLVTFTSAFGQGISNPGRQLTGVYDTVNALGSAGGTRTADFSAGNVVTATVATSANTFAVTNPPATGIYGGFTLILTNGGSQTVTWMTTTIWGGGVAPTLTASGVDVLTFFTINGGTTWYGFLVGADVK